MFTTTKLRVPDFLIIGAMKAGTTTIFEDLQTQPRIFFPVHKEPHSLCFDRVLNDEGLARYAQLFRKARADQLCGDASTGYAKLPTRPGVALRALRVLGQEARIVYSVREPIARALSHHRHLFLEGSAPASFEKTLRETPDLINFSLYAMQIEPWIEAFGREQVHIIQLENYARNRRKGLSELAKFLGFDARPELVQEEVSYNAARDRKKTPAWLAAPLRKVARNGRYRFMFRPLIPDDLIAFLKKILLERAPVSLPNPHSATIEQIINAVSDDAERLRKIMGREEPLWDFGTVRLKYIDPPQ